MPAVYNNLDSARGNLLINGNFDFWQRQITFSNIDQSTYCADRWVSYNGTVATVNVTRQDISALGIGSQYCLRSDRSASTGAWAIESNLERSVLQKLRGKYVTFSILIRKGSALTADLDIKIQTTTTELRGGTSVENSTLTIPNASLSTSIFRRFSVRLLIPVGTTANGLRVSVGTTGTQAGGANVFFEVAQAMFNEGSTASPFSIASRTISEEFDACLRYYEKSYLEGIFPGSSDYASTIQQKIAAADFLVLWHYGVPKRVVPTVVLRTPTAPLETGRWRDNSAGLNKNVQVTGDSSHKIMIVTNSESAVANNIIIGHFTADAEL